MVVYTQDLWNCGMPQLGYAKVPVVLGTGVFLLIGDGQDSKDAFVLPGKPEHALKLPFYVPC